MPQSRKRPGHVYQKPADIPASQRTRGRIIWALLFAVFGGLVAVFGAGINYTAIAIGLVAGGGVGYIIGKSMEKDAKNKA